MRNIWKRIKPLLEAAEHIHFLALIVGAVFAWQSWAWGVGIGLATLFVAAADGRSLTDVWLAVLIAGAATVAIAAGVTVVLQVVRISRTDPRSAEQPAKNAEQLQISVGDDGPFFDVPKYSLYGITRRFKLEVRNVDRSKTISECKVQITTIEPYSGYRGPWVLGKDIILTAGDQTYIPVAQYGEARDKEKFNCAATMIEICCEGKAPLLQFEQENVLTIRATARDTAFCEIQCIIWVDEFGRFRIRKAGTLRDEDIPLLEAATQAYERTRGHPISAFAEADSKSPEEILRWYCYALIIARESLGGKPLMRLFGTHPPSRVKELISVRNSHTINIRPSGAYLMENGQDVFAELTVRASELSYAVALMSSWAKSDVEKG